MNNLVRTKDSFEPTSRDNLAAIALAGIGSWIPPVDIVDEEGLPLQTYNRQWGPAVQKVKAEWAYAQADAMLAAREASHEE